MRVAGLQIDIAWESPPENFLRARGLAESAAAAGARLVVLPEMFATGFSMRAEVVAPHAGAVRDFLAELARRLGIWALGGYAEPGEPLAYNACSLFDPGGAERLRYRKIHPFTLAGEGRHYQGGTALPTAEVEGVRLTPLICYDLRFPEVFRAAAEETDLFAVLANWPEKRSEAWRLLLRARAVENQAYVLGVNRVGVGSGEPHRGDTALVAPTGDVLSAFRDRESVVAGDVDPEAVRRARRAFRFLDDRRPEVYGRLRAD